MAPEEGEARGKTVHEIKLHPEYPKRIFGQNGGNALIARTVVKLDVFEGR